jgi:hypothetical protein
MVVVELLSAVEVSTVVESLPVESAKDFSIKSPSGSLKIVCRNDVELASAFEGSDAGGVTGAGGSGGVGIGGVEVEVVDGVVGTAVDDASLPSPIAGVVEVAVLVASSTLLHPALSASLLVAFDAWFAKITFHEKCKVTAVGV